MKKACYRIVLALVTLLTTFCLQAATTVESANIDKTVADLPKTIVEQRNLLAASDRSVTRHELIIDEKKLAYTATAGSLDVSDKLNKPVGRMFYINYTADDTVDKSRPLTFVFNGGPGAASAYLHLGALGPTLAVFATGDSVLSVSTSLKDNKQSWLRFTDLVFVDPIDTRHSREFLDQNEKSVHKDALSSDTAQFNGRAWGVSEDIDVLAQFIRAYLAHEERWMSPLYLVGERFGGFRVARLASLLFTDFDIDPSGLVLISPALNFSLLRGDDLSLWPWVALLPSYAAVAGEHGQGLRFIYPPDNPRGALKEVERFALNEYLTGLAGNKRTGWLEKASQLLGLDVALLQRWNGRVPQSRFVKVLLKKQSRLISLYDGSISLPDPDPARSMLIGEDPYLERLNAPVMATFNSYVRNDLEFQTDSPGLLLNKTVLKSWNWQSEIAGREGFVGTIADLKRTLSVSPNLQVLVVHGIFDLVTPYFASVIALEQMRLDPIIEANIRLKVYHGGHMPYLHQRSRLSLFNDAQDFYKRIPHITRDMHSNN